MQKSAEHAALHGDPQPNQPGQVDAGARFQAEAQRRRSSLAREFVEFLAANKKWWLAPIVVAVLLIGALVVLSGTAAAPFIYTLF